MLEKVSKKISLTQTEIKIMLFVVSILVIGFGYKNFFKDTNSVPYKVIDYSGQDSIFNNSGKDSLKSKNLSKSVDKKVDYKQEVLDFNTRSFDNVQKKTFPAENSVNLNSASLNDLLNLPGIGEKTAEKIIEYRDHVKKFSKVEELLSVRGIGESRLNKIKKYLFID
jgi:comEA protein